VGEGVLIPRPETELLVDLAIAHNPQIVLDLCAGTGCVGIAIAKESGCNVIAVEKSPKAIEYLRKNVSLNGVEKQVEIVQDDVINPKQFSIVDCRLSIVINPPYLSKKEMQSLQKEVTFEPEMALYGGGNSPDLCDGLDFYRRFFEVWGNDLKQASLLGCEVGDTQAQAVCKMMKDIGLNPRIKKDYNKIDRVVYSIGVSRKKC
jgi:release factor glutamine methyltransferase